MFGFEIGIVMPVAQYGPARTTPRWAEIRTWAQRAEQIGFDTVWIPDELLWRAEDGPPRGVWEGVAMAGAVAASTSTVKVGTWVLSALHRNAAITAKIAETLDEISGGRFVFGLGAGHVWPGQAHAFGLPEDHVFDRFAEALAVIIPLLREGRADVEGTWHSARDLPQQPVGPRPQGIPLLIGGNGPKGQRHAALHADIYSCYVEEHADLEELAPRIASFEAVCADVGRDPMTIGRSVGVPVEPLERLEGRPGIVCGSAEEIADRFRSYREAGFSQVEIMPARGTLESLEALVPVVEAFRAERQ